MRDDPASTSAPTSVMMAKSAARSSGELRLQVSAMVRAPRRRAYSTAAMVKGVRPLVAMPRTASCFPGGSESLRPSRHDVLHAAWIRIESWRNLGGVERPESAAGSSTNIDEASPLAQPGCDHVDSTSNLRQSAPDRHSHGGVLLVDESHNFQRRHAVEIGGSRKVLFSG